VRQSLDVFGIMPYSPCADTYHHSFVGGKVPCPYGPSAGDEGFRKNVEYFKDWREKVGPDYPLMLDCYMALTVPYAIKLAKALQPYGLKWIEECLHPDDYDGYEQVGLLDSMACL
jgi:L-rhamnonate dehydratase